MADFDFDELDRAVSGALNGDEPKVTDTSGQPVETQVNDMPTTEPVSTVPPTSVSVPAVAPAARRSSGRFMDVVHPSSDMRTATNGANVPSRPAPVLPVANPTSENSNQITEQNPNDLGDWAQPLESPFLPDTKVEKRPLGGVAPSEADFDALELLEAPDDPRIEADTMPDPIDFAHQTSTQPAEVEVQQSEAETVVDEAISDLQFDETPAKIETTEVVAVENQAETPVEPVVATESFGAAYGQGSFQEESSQEVPVGPTSIPQQYQEQPATTDVENTPIYDAEAYQPVTPAPKKKSGAWVVLWIVLLVILGGGAGAAIYFYVLPML